MILNIELIYFLELGTIDCLLMNYHKSNRVNVFLLLSVDY